MDESPRKQERRLEGADAPDTASHDTDSTLALDHNDDVQFGLDQLETQNGHLNFQVHIRRAGHQHSFEISIDFNQLSTADQERIKRVLEQYALWSVPERASGLSWLLEQALKQQGLDKEEREARIRTLLLCDSQSPSYKEKHFHQEREKFLASGGIEFFNEDHVREFPPEVPHSWSAAVNKFTFGLLPRGLSPGSPAEQRELELLILKLRHGDSITAAIADHASVVDKWITNQTFRSAIARAIESRDTPDNRKIASLDYYVLRTWLPAGLWLLSNKDRAVVLRKVYGITEVSGDGVRKAVVDRLKLVDYTHFQPKGTAAPYIVHCFYEGEQEMYQICPRN